MAATLGCERDLLDESCPNCGSNGLLAFYEAREVPVHSVLLMTSKEMARGYPRGDILLGFCRACGFITNTRFDDTLLESSDRCEESQGYSETFKAFHSRLAKSLIDRYDLNKKTVLEIGCGKGEFLALLCELGDNRGVGFDPAYVPGRIPESQRLTFIRDFYSEEYLDYDADFVCCKMTLEHIHQTRRFLQTARRAIGKSSHTVVFFQVPNVSRILSELAFWDIYYEHCSYFSSPSLAYLFENSGFNVLRLETDYDDQYLMIEARPAEKAGESSVLLERDLFEHQQAVESFARDYAEKVHYWNELIQDAAARERRTVLWGAGSKATAFLCTLGRQSEIEYVVDISPHKQGTFIAGTGQEIVSPPFLKTYRPGLVIVMNPVYCDEIRVELSGMGLSPQVLAV